jgi:hypothetical protein
MCLTPTPSPTPTPTPTPPACNEVFVSNTLYATTAQACSAAPAGSRNKTDGDPLSPQLGDIIYTDAGCTTTKAAGIYYHADATAAITIGSGGSITAILFC